MGTEGFFVNLMPAEANYQPNISFPVGKSSLPSWKIFEIIRNNHEVRITTTHSFVSNCMYFIIDNCLLAWLEDQGGYFCFLSLEGCFSWYEENLELICRLAEEINAQHKVYLGFPPQTRISCGAKEKFIEEMNRSHAPGRARFMEFTSGLHAPILPQGFYYNLIRKLHHPAGKAHPDQIKGTLEKFHKKFLKYTFSPAASVEELLKELNDHKSARRQMECLIRICLYAPEAEKAIETVRGFLKSKNQKVRISAIICLSYICSMDSKMQFDVFCESVKDKQPGVRLAALNHLNLELLPEMSQPIVGELLPMLRDRNRDVRNRVQFLFEKHLNKDPNIEKAYMKHLP